MKKKKKVIVIQCSSKYFCSWLWSGTIHLEINTSGHEVLKSEKEKRKKRVFAYCENGPQPESKTMKNPHGAGVDLFWTMGGLAGQAAPGPIFPCQGRTHVIIRVQTDLDGLAFIKIPVLRGPVFPEAHGC